MEPRPSILIIDDDPGMRETLELILRRKGYLVQTAPTAEAGIGEAETGSYNIIFLDVKLPDAQGVHLLPPLQELHPEAALIVITGHASVKTAVQALNEGAAAYVTKPLDMDEVLATVDGALDRQRLLEEKREAERALKESKEQYELLAENAADIIYKLNIAEASYTYVSPSVERILGYAPEAVASMGPSDVLTAESCARQAQGLARALDAGKMVSDPLELEAIHKDGHIVPIEVRAKVVVGEHRAPVEIIGVARDISKRVRIEEQLRQRERLAALGQMASGIAHDFRNRLNPIILYTEMALRQRDLAEGLKESLEIILDESRGMTDLVQQILDFASRSMIDRRPLNLAELVQGVAGELRSELPAHIYVDVRRGPGTYTVLADAERIRQALRNMGLNARDAMPDGGILRFELMYASVTEDEMPRRTNRMEARPGCDEWICLAVSDTGIGMTDEVRTHLFEPFFTTKDVGQGTGLGLSQAHGVVRQHGGWIDVDTALGEGTSFRIYLPPYEGNQNETTHRESPTASRGEGATILLVVGGQTLRNAVSGALESMGHRVLPAASRTEALALSQSPRWGSTEPTVDLVVIDQETPEEGGKALMRELRRGQPDLRAVIVGHDREDSAVYLKSAGVVDVVHKPFDAQRLAEAVQQALDR